MLDAETVANWVVGLTIVGFILCVILFLVPSVREKISVYALAVAMATILSVNQIAWWYKIGTRRINAAAMTSGALTAGRVVV